MPVEHTNAIAPKADYRKVEALFEPFEKVRADTRNQVIAQEICNELRLTAAKPSAVTLVPA